MNKRSGIILFRTYYKGAVRTFRHRPTMLMKMGALFLKSRNIFWNQRKTKIFIGTHHKSLTVYMVRIFRAFSVLSNRSISVGAGSCNDYESDIVIDVHSEFIFSDMPQRFNGLHINRDPRDLLISSVFYHLKADEPWLVKKRKLYGGVSYQDKLKSMPDNDSMIMFEIDHAAGDFIDKMARWRVRDNFEEAWYHDLISKRGNEVFDEILAKWSLQRLERELLGFLFWFYSINGIGIKGDQHVRDPESGQWEQYFTPNVEKKFKERFGYNEKCPD